jgi:hypothetical protein
MTWQHVAESDRWGRFFIVANPENRSFESYFNTLTQLRPMLRSQEWHDRTTGYFLNIAGGCAVRLTYFTSKQNGDEIQNLVDTYTANHVLRVDPERTEPLKDAGHANDYGGSELELPFRHFLCSYSDIALDLLKNNALCTRQMAICYRLQVFPQYGRPGIIEECRDHFEPDFQQRSDSYRQLSDEERDEFWSWFGKWPNPPQVDWAHLFINLVLPGDVMDFFALCATGAVGAFSTGQIN